MADKEWTTPGTGTLSGSTEDNLPGFSSNAGWAGVQEDGLWSHNPDHLGPKEGFHDPVDAAPARQSLVPNAEDGASSDDALTGGRF